MGSSAIILFELNFPHLHYNEIQHVCEAISTLKCLVFTLLKMVMQMKKSVNCHKGKRTKKRIRCQYLDYLAITSPTRAVFYLVS